jgi:hypothetical protein
VCVCDANIFLTPPPPHTPILVLLLVGVGTEVQMIGAERLSDDGVPRLSLIMPTPDTLSQHARAKNGSRPDLSLLQIDCNVERSKIVTVGYRNATVAE